jgi:hypothetical protein
MIQQTTLKAYKSIRQSLGSREMQVYEVIQRYGMTSNFLIAKVLNLPINCITGRTRGMVKKGYVVDSGKRIIHNNRKHILWSCIPPFISYGTLNN